VAETEVFCSSLPLAIPLLQEPSRCTWLAEAQTLGFNWRVVVPISHKPQKIQTHFQKYIPISSKTTPTIQRCGKTNINNSALP